MSENKVTQKIDAAQLPLIIYGIDGKPLGKYFVSNNYCFTLYSYKKFPIRVLSGECMIYTAQISIPGRDQVLQTPKISKSENFVGNDINNSYTLFMKSDCILLIGDSEYVCKLDLDNIFSEEQDDDKEWVNSHYNYLLTNYNLPTWEELYPAWFGDDKREIIKRMLLDFRRILRLKGTIESIKLFFKFIQLSNIKVFEEYAYIAKNGLIEKTIKPDKDTDWKTADYWVIFNNWIEKEGNDGLDRKNMPIRILQYTDMKGFFERLMYAIIIADKYFTLPEQDLSFFGMVNSANSYQYPGVVTSSSQIRYDDVCWFRKNLTIDIVNFHTTTDKTYLVKDNLQKKRETSMSEIKVITQEGYKENMDMLFFVEREYQDDEPAKITDENANRFISMFGNALHLFFKTKNTYIKVFIEHTIDSTVNITYEKTFIEDSTEIIFVTKMYGLYRVTVEVWDVHNNREKYIFYYQIVSDAKKVDFETFNSSYVSNGDPINTITTGVSSPSFYPINFDDFMNYVLYNKDVPEDLQFYFDGEHELMDKARHYLTNRCYMLPTLNQNYSLDEVSDSLPLEFIESWCDVYAFKVTDDRKLMLRVYDGNLCENILIPYNKIKKHINELSDKLYVCLWDVYESQEHAEYDIITPYAFLMTTEIGIDIKSLYDFCWCEGVVGSKEYYTEKDFKSVTSIYDDRALYRRIPVNHDFEMYLLDSQSKVMHPEFINYMSGIGFDGKTNVRALFPRLVNISEAGKYGVPSTYELELGDVIYCQKNDDYIVGETDNIWEVRNAFDNSVIFTTTDENLKYRIEDRMIYTIVFKFRINGEQYELKKESLVSSFAPKCNI